MATMPRYINTIPSQMEDNIFRKYFTVACDFMDIFDSTQCFIITAQHMHLTTNSIYLTMNAITNKVRKY